jgi:hypothetical protein
MKYKFEMKLIRRLASASVVAVAAYVFSSGSCYAQQATPAPSPAASPAVTASDGKEAKKVAEQPKPPEPRFKLYGWIEADLPVIQTHRSITTTSVGGNRSRQRAGLE